MHDAKPWPIASNRQGERSSKANGRMSGPSGDDKCAAKVHYHLSSIRLSTPHRCLSNARKTVSVDTATYTILGMYGDFPQAGGKRSKLPIPPEVRNSGTMAIMKVYSPYRLICPIHDFVITDSEHVVERKSIWIYVVLKISYGNCWVPVD